MYRTGSKPAKLSTRSTTCLPKKNRPKPPRMQRDQSTSSCQIQAAALTMFAQSVRNDLRTSGSTRSRNGYGSIQCWWATGHITPHAVPRQRGTENRHLDIHGELQSPFWGREKQRRVFCLQRLECRSRLCSDMSILLIKRKRSVIWEAIWRLYNGQRFLWMIGRRYVRMETKQHTWIGVWMHCESTIYDGFSPARLRDL
jgi:hypothetical protein